MLELLTLVPVLGIALAWRNFFGLSSSVAVFHAVASIILVLFVGGLLGLLYPTTVAIMAAGFALFVVAGSKFVRERTLIPLPLLLLVLFATVFWVIQRDSSFTYYDEYSHWGVYLRDMLHANAFWDASSNAMHLRYVPGTALWQYFFAVFSNRPEGAAYLAQFVLVLSALLVLWERLGYASVGWHVLITGLVVVAIYNFGHGFASLYLDHILGVWFAGVLLGFLYELDRLSMRKLLCFGLPLAAFALFKSTGFFFLLACGGVIGLLSLTHSDLQKTATVRRLGESAVLPVAAVLLGALLTAAWGANRDSIELPESLASTSNLASSVVKRDSVFSEEEQVEITRRFVQVVFSQQISKDELSATYNAFSYPLMPLYTDRFRLTTASFLGLAAIFIILLARFPPNPDTRTRWLIAQGMTWLITIAYIGVVFMGYRYIANDQKAIDLSSYVRYVHSMLLPLFLLCFAPLVPAFGAATTPRIAFGDSLKIERYAVVFGAALLALLVFETPYVKRLYSAQEAPPLRLQTEPLTTAIRAEIGEAPLWVFFPNTQTNGFIGQLMQFQLSPGKTFVEEDIGMLLDNKEQFLESMRGYDYAWFVVNAPEIDAALEDVPGATPEAWFYRVITDTESVRLEPVQLGPGERS